MRGNLFIDVINEERCVRFPLVLALRFGFKKVSKKADNIRVEDIGLAFRQSGQNPTEDTVKDMIEKAKTLKKAQLREQDEDDDGEERQIHSMNASFLSSCCVDARPDDQLSFVDFLTLVHEYWIPPDDDKQQLQEAFDVLDPQNKSKLMVDEFAYLLKNCDWPDEEIQLILSQVSCADGYFLHDGNTYSSD